MGENDEVDFSQFRDWHPPKRPDMQISQVLGNGRVVFDGEKRPKHNSSNPEMTKRSKSRRESRAQNRGR